MMNETRSLNLRELTNRDRAVQAFQANRQFLANPAPTVAEVRDQVRLLTRECQHLLLMSMSTHHPDLLDNIGDT